MNFSYLFLDYEGEILWLVSEMGLTHHKGISDSENEKVDLAFQIQSCLVFQGSSR